MLDSFEKQKYETIQCDLKTYVVVYGNIHRTECRKIFCGFLNLVAVTFLFRLLLTTLN